MNIRTTIAWLSLFAVGCGTEPLPVDTVFRTDTAPGPLMTVKAVKDEITAGAVNPTVRIAGRIYAGPDSPPWEEGKAAFMLAESSHGDDKDHDPFACPYCSRKIDQYQAFIRFHDDQQQVINVDARHYFGVADRQFVVVEGVASLDTDNYLQISGTRLFIAPPDWVPDTPLSADSDNQSENPEEQDAQEEDFTGKNRDEDS